MLNSEAVATKSKDAASRTLTAQDAGQQRIAQLSSAFQAVQDATGAQCTCSSPMPFTQASEGLWGRHAASRAGPVAASRGRCQQYLRLSIALPACSATPMLAASCKWICGLACARQRYV